MSYSDIRSLPLPYRRWFIDRLSDEFKKTSEARKKASDERQGLRDIPMGEMAQMMEEIESKTSFDKPLKFRKG